MAAAPAPATAKPAAPVAAAPAPKPAAPAAGAKKGGNLDDEFAALLSELNVDLAQVELPKKAAKPSPIAAAKDDDLGIPDLVTVKDDELPEGEELEPLPDPKGKGAPAKPAAAPAKPGAAAPAKPGVPAVAAKPGAPAVAAGKPGSAASPSADAAPKKSKRWLWITAAATTIGGAGVVVAHFVLHLF
ncbi:MAG: hypothetical protein U1F43_31180 [Myxococcota bacterium]